MLAEIVTIMGVDSESGIEEGVAGGERGAVFRANVGEFIPTPRFRGLLEESGD